jgi:hypothetical protein
LHEEVGEKFEWIWIQVEETDLRGDNFVEDDKDVSLNKACKWEVLFPIVEAEGQTEAHLWDEAGERVLQEVQQSGTLFEGRGEAEIDRIEVRGKVVPMVKAAQMVEVA